LVELGREEQEEEVDIHRDFLEEGLVLNPVEVLRLEGSRDERILLHVMFFVNREEIIGMLVFVITKEVVDIGEWVAVMSD
uniref:N-acetyltransferase domain-containing protein n=1 Tax=Mesocestoides corti TaxID=53468 RepID=A0A0R3UR91_MESCO